jgi:hypothetical protein
MKCNPSSCPHCGSLHCYQIEVLRKKLERLELTGDSDSPMITSLKHIILEWISEFEAAKNGNLTSTE